MHTQSPVKVATTHLMEGLCFDAESLHAFRKTKPKPVAAKLANRPADI
jgi:hypothetical protein